MTDQSFSIFKFLRNIVLGTLLCGLLFGIAGFLLGGNAGFANMASWGLVIGFFGSLVLGATMLLSPHSMGTDFEKFSIHSLGEWFWFIKRSDRKDKKND